MSEGWVKLHRSCLQHWITSDFTMFGFWCWLITRANRQPKKWLYRGTLYEMDPGQVLISIHDTAREHKISHKTLGRYLDLLETEQQIVQKRDKRGTVITILNYSKYQELVSLEGTTEGQETGQPRPKIDPDTFQPSPSNKNHKNHKKEENHKKNTPRSALPVCPPELSSETWELWLQHRREKKSPVTPTSAAQIFKKYSGRPAEFIRDVQHSISNGWTGLFESRDVAPGSKIAQQSGSDIESIAKRALGGFHDKP